MHCERPTTPVSFTTNDNWEQTRLCAFTLRDFNFSIPKHSQEFLLYVNQGAWLGMNEPNKWRDIWAKQSSSPALTLPVMRSSLPQDGKDPLRTVEMSEVVSGTGNVNLLLWHFYRTVLPFRGPGHRGPQSGGSEITAPKEICVKFCVYLPVYLGVGDPWLHKGVLLPHFIYLF